MERSAWVQDSLKMCPDTHWCQMCLQIGESIPKTVEICQSLSWVCKHNLPRLHFLRLPLVMRNSQAARPRFSAAPPHCTFRQPGFRNTKHTMNRQIQPFARSYNFSMLGEEISNNRKSCHCLREWCWCVRISVAIWITAVGDRRTKPCFRWELPPQSAAEIEFKSLLLDATVPWPQITLSRLQTELKC